MRSLVFSSLFTVALGLIPISSFALEVGDHAPCVILNNIAPNGTESEHCIRQPNVEGQYKILEFFSATCSDCAENLPIVSDLSSKVQKQATTRQIGLDRNEQLLRNYIQSNRSLLSFEVALDTSRNATHAYGVSVTPSTFVLDPKDTVVFKHEGVLSSSDVQEIEHLVGAQ